MARGDQRRFQLSVLDSLFGGSLSSRSMFQEVREKRGLVYSVYSFSSLYAETGLTGLYFGCRPERLDAVIDTVGRSWSAWSPNRSRKTSCSGPKNT